MDVRCERCQTEYDFDDALVSDRGTTVKCTSCGHQFKVYPASAGVVAEQWVVRSAQGVEVTFTSLRDLQRAITEGRIFPEDVLVRRGMPPRPLRSIAELDHFFGARRATGGAKKKTLAGVAPPGGALSASKVPAPPEHGRGGAARDRVAERGAAASAPDPDGVDAFDGERPTLPHSGLAPFPGAIGAARAARARGTAERADAHAPTQPLAAVGDSGARHEPTPAASRPLTEATGVAGSAGTTAGGAASTSTAREGASEREGARTILGLAPIEELAPAAEPRAGEGDDALAPAVAEPRAGEGDDALAPAVAEPAAPPAVAEPAPGATTLPVPAEAVAPAAEWTAEPDTEPALPSEASPATPADGRGEERAVSSARPRRSDPAEPFYTPPPRERVVSAALSDADPRFVTPSRARRVRAAWIVGVIMVGSLVLIAATLGVSFLRGGAQPTGSVEARGGRASADPRVMAFLADGRRLVAEGNLEPAAAAFTKASALAERDPEVLAALAEIEVVRADVAWLRVRLVDPASDGLVDAAQRELASRLGVAREAVDAAVSGGVSEPLARRLRVDLLRLSGSLQDARSLVEPLAERPADPETTYVLGALDLAEDAPAWRSAAARFRTAAAAEGRLGRARAALVYTLARSGDLEGARRELGQLATTSPNHPLLEDLRRFVERRGPAVEAPDAGARSADAGLLPSHEDGGAADLGVDFRERLRQASDALASRDPDRAERLYRSVLAEQPGNTEALAGVAEVARQRNDPRAAELYDAVLQKNPSYVPAIIARADQKWAAGDRAGAVPLYQRVLAQVGADSSYGRHAAARIAEGSRSDTPRDAVPTGTPTAARAPAPTAPASPPAPPPTAPPPAGDTPPSIDTTDLPNF